MILIAHTLKMSQCLKMTKKYIFNIKTTLSQVESKWKQDTVKLKTFTSMSWPYLYIVPVIGLELGF